MDTPMNIALPDLQQTTMLRSTGRRRRASVDNNNRTRNAASGLVATLPIQFLVETPRGRTAAVTFPNDDHDLLYNAFVSKLLQAAMARDLEEEQTTLKASDCRLLYWDECEQQPPLVWSSEESSESEESECDNDGWWSCRKPTKRQRLAVCHDNVVVVHQGKPIDKETFSRLFMKNNSSFTIIWLSIKLRGLRGGMVDRQNRVGSKFGGGGVSSSQQAERERKERLKQLALESIDLAKDPYLMRNHLGTYECKLCLTLHTNEANYLAHTQGKKHQQGLARRAHMEKIRQQQQQNNQGDAAMISSMEKTTTQVIKRQRVKIGRPAYQVFKSRDAETNQRCLSFELHFPEMDAESLQPRHRFMSAFEQRVESPPDRRFQYLLFAAEPYETVAFKIPNEPIDKGEGRFVTHWDADDKKFTLTLYFLDDEEDDDAKPAAVATTS